LLVLFFLAGCSFREEAVREGHTTSEWIATLEESTDQEMRLKAITILGDMGPDEAAMTLRPLSAAIKDPDPVIRFYTLEALGKLGNKARGSMDAVASAMSDKDRRVARKATKVHHQLVLESVKSLKKAAPPAE